MEGGEEEPHTRFVARVLRSGAPRRYEWCTPRPGGWAWVSESERRAHRRSEDGHTQRALARAVLSVFKACDTYPAEGARGIKHDISGPTDHGLASHLTRA